MLSLIVAVGLNPESLINKFGLIGLFLIVFLESCLVFFLPGDSLLFTAGLLVATSSETGIFKHPIGLVVGGVVVAAFLGDQVGYQVGKRLGPALFSRPNSKLFKPKHVTQVQGYFDKHGARTIVIARFVPVVRTFTPIVAGISSMPYRIFVTYNLLGGVLWGAGVTMAGWFLGDRFPALGKRIELLSLVIVFVSVLPVIIDIRRHRREKASGSH